MKSALVTIILPYYNRIWGLKWAVESILIQDYMDWKVFVMDDYGKDEAGAYITGLNDNRFNYIRQEYNKGVAANWIDGINRVNTPYCCLLMDDDWYGEGFLASRLAVFKKIPNLGVVYGPYKRVNEKLPRSLDVKPKSFGIFDNKELQRNMITRDNFIGATMFRTEVIQKASSEALQYGLVVDYALLIYSSLLSKCSGFAISDQNFFYREHPDTLSNLKENDVWKQCLRLLKKLMVDFPEIANDVQNEGMFQAIYSARMHKSYFARVKWGIEAIKFFPYKGAAYRAFWKSLIGFQG